MTALEFRTLGRAFRATGARGELARWLQFHWKLEGVPERHPFRITLDVVNRPSVCPAWADAQMSALDGISLVWQRHGERWWSTGEHDAGVELKLDSTGANITAWTARRFATHTRAFVAVDVAICEALRASGLVPLHAAIAARDGQATAFVGLTGAEKSTTLVSAINAGWTPVTEDSSWLDPATRHVYGADRDVRQTERRIGRVGWQPDAQLTRIGVLVRNPQRDSDWEPLATRDKVRSLWNSTGVPLCSVNRADFARHLPPLLSQLDVSRLVLGNTCLPL